MACFSKAGEIMDIGLLLVIPAMLFAFWAQFKVQSTFKKYSGYNNLKGYTGADAAKQILITSGVGDVTVERIKGNLTDHYDPRTRVLRLSDSVYDSRSLAAVGVAAHETGHAIQHAEGYTALNLRNGIFPLVSVGSRLAVPLIIIGFLLSSLSAITAEMGIYIVYIGIALFMAVVMFQIITLPVEFNASRRAIAMLGDYNILSSDELKPARKVLNAAAMTYIAATAVAILQLVRFILIAGNRRR